jgi:hypothetical protein
MLMSLLIGTRVRPWMVEILGKTGRRNGMPFANKQSARLSPDVRPRLQILPTSGPASKHRTWKTEAYPPLGIPQAGSWGKVHYGQKISGLRLLLVCPVIPPRCKYIDTYVPRCSGHVFVELSALEAIRDSRSLGFFQNRF